MGAKILIIDDEKLFLDSLRRSLTRRFEIVTVESGEEGLMALKSQDLSR